MKKDLNFYGFVPGCLAFLIEGLDKYFEPLDKKRYMVNRKGDDFYLVDRGEMTMTQTDEFVLFFGGPFSQWYPSLFEIDGVGYNCAEQWMMACKARMFKDKFAEKFIMAADQPWDQKAMGRRVKDFDQEIWEKDARDLVKQGSRAKYDQNPALKRDLMSTGDKLLVEASPTDVIWGIGLAEDDPKARDRDCWRGTNWLGEVLTELREEYKLEG